MSVEPTNAAAIMEAADVEVASLRDLTVTPERKRASQFRRNLHRFLVKNRLNLVGVIIVFGFLFLSLLGPTLAPYDPNAQDITNSKLLGPSLDHPFGTDELGRDVLSRIMAGTRISLQVAVVVLGFAVTFGTIVGAISGFFGGFVDEVLMRFTDMFLAFPAFVLAIAIAASLGKSLTNTMIALSTVFWPWYARLVRGQVLAIKERDFVDAARSVGLSPSRLLFRHILPNVASLLIIDTTLNVGTAILAETGLSFLGFGIQPPDVSLGTLIADGTKSATIFPWVFLFPAGVLVLIVLCANLIGDGLRDALDPAARPRRRRS